VYIAIALAAKNGTFIKHLHPAQGIVGGGVTAINLFALKLLLIIAKIEIKFPEKSIKIYNI